MASSLVAPPCFCSTQAMTSDRDPGIADSQNPYAAPVSLRKSSDVDRDREPNSSELKHSGIGIASFVIAIVAAVGILATVGIAGYLEASIPGGIDDDSPRMLAIGCSVIVAAGLELLALPLGLVGLFQRERKKVFAVLGTAISGLFVLGVVGLVVLGLALG